MVPCPLSLKATTSSLGLAQSQVTRVSAVICPRSGCFACTIWLNGWNWTELYLYCAVAGSAGTVYDGLAYKLSIKFPSGQGGACYPYAPPVVKFETPCFHPNVDQHGNICLDILKEKWSACYNIRTILLSIQSMLGDPNNDSPLNGYAAALWDNQEEYRKTNLRKYEEDKKDGDSSWTSSIQNSLSEESFVYVRTTQECDAYINFSLENRGWCNDTGSWESWLSVGMVSSSKNSMLLCLSDYESHQCLLVGHLMIARLQNH